MFVRQLNVNDVTSFQQLLAIFREVFEVEKPEPDLAHLKQLLASPEFMVYIVGEDDRIYGGLTCYILQGYYDSRPQAYIYDVGITPEQQGKGFGKYLIDNFLHDCERNNLNAAYVEAEKDDEAAVSFYRANRFDEEMAALHFTRYF